MDFPILLSLTTPENREIRQKNYNFNLYNEIICKTNNHHNNKKFRQIGNEGNYTHQNISSGNIIHNNTFIPLTETKYNYLNNNNTYFHTNFVFKIDNSSNFNKKLYKGNSHKQTPNKKRSKNFKKFFDINNNNYRYFTQDDNNSNCNINNNNVFNIQNSIGKKKYYEEKKENIQKLRNPINSNKISFKQDNNTSNLSSIF